MKTTLICAALGACAACGTPDSNTPVVTPRVEAASGTQIDVELQPFVDEFMQDCHTRRSDCAEKLDRIRSIRVAEIPDLNTKDDEVIIGLCYDNIFNRRIEINKNIVKKSYIYVRLVLYHEIGHCGYGLDHDEDDRNAIMASHMPAMFFIVNNWEEMVVDLFDTIQQKHGD